MVALAVIVGNLWLSLRSLFEATVHDYFVDNVRSIKLSKSQMPIVGVVVLCVGVVFGGFWAYAKFSDRIPNQVTPTPQPQIVNTQPTGLSDSQQDVDASTEAAPKSADDVIADIQSSISSDTRSSTSENRETSTYENNGSYPDNAGSNGSSSDNQPNYDQPQFEAREPTEYELYHLASDFQQNRVRFDQIAAKKTIVTSGQFLSAQTFFDDERGVKRIVMTLAYDAYDPEGKPKFAVFSTSGGLHDNDIAKLRKGQRVTVVGYFVNQSQRIHLSIGTVEAPVFSLFQFR
jgi:hypothetical protein